MRGRGPQVGRVGSGNLCARTAFGLHIAKLCKVKGINTVRVNEHDKFCIRSSRGPGVLFFFVVCFTPRLAYSYRNGGATFIPSHDPADRSHSF
jgi:hypothetical protein